MKNVLRLAVLMVSTQALAQRICIAPFTGPGGNAARNQLVSAVCDTADCVAATKATTGNKPDWKKAKKEAVQFFITGAVAKKGKKITLQVLDKPGAPKLNRQYALEKDGLAAKTLATAIEAIKGSLGGAAVEVPPPPPPPDKLDPVRPPGKTDPVPPPKRDPEREVVKDPEREEPPPKVKRRTDHFLVLDLGSDVLNRRLDYVQAATPNLRRYDLTLFPLPRVGLELYPLVLLDRDDLLRGLGVEASFGLMPLLKTKRLSDDSTFPTTTMRIDGGVRWKLKFSKDFPLAVVPFVGLRVHAFTVGVNTADGTRLDGVPNLNYVGLRAGLGLEVPVADELITLYAQFAVIPVFASGEIISAAFFPTGSNLGLDGAGGVGVRILPILQLRAVFTFTQYSLRFTTGATDQYVAVGAVDRYLGGNLSARLQF